MQINCIVTSDNRSMSDPIKGCWLQLWWH